MTDPVSHASLRDAILQVRAGRIAQGVCLYDIGDGGCYDFADDVMDLVFGKDWRLREGRSGWQTLTSEQFYLPPAGSDCTIGAAAWDWDLLETCWGMSVPEADRPRHDAIVLRDPSHCWIFFDGRHYDCEHPAGVQSFFELTFFRRWLA